MSVTGKEVIYSIAWTVEAGREEEFRALISEANEIAREKSGVNSYEWFWSDNGSRICLLEQYPDSEALLPHMNALGDVLRRMFKISKMIGWDVFGNLDKASRDAVEKLGAHVYSRLSGFNRGKVDTI